MMLEAKALRLAVPGRVLCTALDAAFAPAESWAILGANGAGKTTLVHALSGLHAPAGGSVSHGGRNLGQLARRDAARQIGVLLQEEEGFWGTAADWVRLGRYPHAKGMAGDPADEALVQRAMERAGVGHLARRAMASLSGGERQRVRIAMVLAQDTSVLILDEPLQHLDLRSQLATLELFQTLVRKEGKTVIMVLHDVYWASRYSDKTLLMFGDGRAAHGETQRVLSRENMETLYGCPLDLVEAGGGRLFLPTGAAR
jgi:iron complex transport system ATP-binding protein